MPYLIGVLLSAGLIGYVIGVNRKPKIITPLSNYEKTIIKEKVRKMSGREYEIFAEKIYKLLGYKTVLTPATNDKGKDIVINKKGEKIYVECKNHKDSSSVGIPEAQKLCGAMVANNITKGIILTFDGANKNCKEYCKKVSGKKVKIESIEVIDLMDLLEQCRKVEAKEILSILGVEKDNKNENIL